MTDIDYGELFGVDLSEGQEPQEQTEAADAGAAETPGSDTESAGNAEKSTDAPEETGTEPEEAGDSTEEEEKPSGKQTKEENARYAAIRRKAEQERDAAIAQVRAEAQKQIDDVFKQSGMVNPYTKQPITSKAEYDEYRTKYDEEQKSRILRKSGMSDDEFKQFVENLPEVRQAKEAAANAEKAQREARDREAKAKIEEQIREISAMDPTIKGLEDLTKMDRYEEFYALVKRGNTLTDAYKLLNFDKLVNRTAQAGRQQAMNAAAGKAHLGKTSSRGQGAVEVPADVKEQYRIFVPDATDAEIQAHYARTHKIK